MQFTFTVLMCYAFINLIQNHHLYKKDQIKQLLVFPHLEQSSCQITYSRKKQMPSLSFTHLWRLGDIFSFILSAYRCGSGQDDFSLRGS